MRFVFFEDVGVTLHIETGGIVVGLVVFEGVTTTTRSAHAEACTAVVVRPVILDLIIVRIGEADPVLIHAMHVVIFNQHAGDVPQHNAVFEAVYDFKAFEGHPIRPDIDHGDECPDSIDDWIGFPFQFQACQLHWDADGLIVDAVFDRDFVSG